MGLTAQAVARAAAARFGASRTPSIEVLPKVRTFEEIKEFIDEHSAVHKRNTGDGRMLVFYTLVDRDLSRQLAEYAGGRETSWPSTS
ncbi:MAG: kinase/pyrophosphorylase [Eggerthellaceae bacterium]